MLVLLIVATMLGRSLGLWHAPPEAREHPPVAAVIVENETCDVAVDEDSVLVISSLGDPLKRFRVTIAPSRTAAAGSRLVPFSMEPPPGDARNVPPRVSRPIAPPMGEVPLPKKPRRFWIHVGSGPLDDPAGYVPLKAVPVATGRFVRVYEHFEPGGPRVGRRTVEEIVRFMEETVVPETASTLGLVRDVDADGRFAVVLSPWLGKLQGGRTSLGGFVRASDFRPGLPAPFSNGCDMLMLNSNVEPGPRLRELLRHEYAHAVSVSLRAADLACPDEEDWLSEAIAHSMEREGTNVDHRIRRFLVETERYPLVIDDYYRAGLWRCDGCRGATFSFLRWCRQRHGAGFLRELVTQRSRGIQNVEAAMDRAFPNLFREWTVALARRGVTFVGETGPRAATCHTWRPEMATLALSIRGTATARVRIAESCRVRISGESGTGLQVTRVSSKLVLGNEPPKTTRRESRNSVVAGLQTGSQ